MELFAVTHRGRIRKQNEDTVFVEKDSYPYIAMVADGMGGHEAGQVASAAAVELMAEKIREAQTAKITPRALQEMVEEISHDVWLKAEGDAALHDMGTTLTVALISADSVVAAHVGDSRAYLYRNGKLRQITTDHSYVQYLVSKGILTQKEAQVHPYRSIITRAVGMETVSAEAYSCTFGEGDTLLLCSDGLTCHVKDRDIARCLAVGGSAADKAETLLQMALQRGGSDNISIVIALNDGGEKA